MGKKKRYFNARARQVVDDSEIRKSHQTPCVVVEVAPGNRHLSTPELPGTSHDSELDSNALVLPGKKTNKETKRLNSEQSQPKQLSKKQRKKLQKILEQKEKKGKRAELLASLAEHQASTEEMAMFSSFAHIGQKINKRKLDNTGSVKINSIGGSNKKRRLQDEDEDSDGEKDDDSASSLSSDEEEEEEEKVETEGDTGEENQREGSDTNNEESRHCNHGDKSSTSIERTLDKEQKSAGAPVDSKARTENDSVNKDKTVKDSVDREPATYVQVKRLPEIQARVCED